MSKFKTSIDFRDEALRAAEARVRDDNLDNESPAVIREASKRYLALVAKGKAITASGIQDGIPWDSTSEQLYLKHLKYEAHINNLKVNKVEDLTGRSVKDNFATLKEIQRELISLSSETVEEESKMLGGYSQVHYNAFVRGVDAPLGWHDLSATRDFKTGFAFKQRELMQVLQNAGLSLPVRDHFEVPILDVYIIDEQTDVGDTMHPIKSTPPKNLIRKNKVFNHVILRKEYDNTSRKYKRKTSYDQYPYNCISTMTVELEMPSLVQINCFKFEPIGDSTIYIPEDGLTYKSEDGSEISLTTMTIPGEVETTLLFQPIHTKYLTIKFEQYGTVGRRDMVLGDRKIVAFNELLESTEMNIRYPSHQDRVKGTVYDFSLANVSVGLYMFEPKGIFRSALSLNVDSPIGFAFRWEAEQLIPFETFDTYLRSAILPEGRTLIESYLYARLYGGQEEDSSVAPIFAGDKKRKARDILKNTLIVDSLVPVPDSYPIQVEYLDFVQDKGRVKLFPKVKIKDKFRIIDICLARYENSVISSKDLDSLAGAKAFVLDKDPETQNKFYSNLKLGLTVTPGLITPESIPSDRRFNLNIGEHVSSRALWLKALNSVTALNRDDLEKELSITFSSPNDDDLSYLMGDLWHRSSEEVKTLIRENPQDFLLLSDGTILGSSKKIENQPTNTVTLYCRTHLYSLQDGAIATPLGQALMNTKLVELTVKSFDGSTNQDIVNVSMRAVREVMSITDSRLDHLSSKDRFLINRFSEINYYANVFRDFIIDSIVNEAYNFPEYAPSTYMNLEKALGLHWGNYYASIVRNTPVLNKEPVATNIVGSSDIEISGSSDGSNQTTGWSYKQSHGFRGSSIVNPVKTFFSNTAGRTLSRTELEKTYHYNSWYYDLVASNGYVAPEPPITHEDIAAILESWYKPGGIRPLEEDKASLAPGLDPYDVSIIDIFLQGNVLWEDTTTSTINNGRRWMQDIFSLKHNNLAWKFKTDGEHSLGIGDIIGFKTKPYQNLDGQYYVIGVEEDAIYVKAFNYNKSHIQVGLSPTIPTLAPGDCDQSAMNQVDYSFGSNATTDPTLMASGNLGCDLAEDANCESGCPEGYECDITVGNCLWSAGDGAGLAGPTATNIFNAYHSHVTNKYWAGQGAGLETLMQTTHAVYACDIFNPTGMLVATTASLGFNILSSDPHAWGNFSAMNLGTGAPWEFDTAETEEPELGAIEFCCSNIDLNEVNAYIFNAGFSEAPIEVYENNCLLAIGENYDITLNDGADWLGTFPLDSSYEFYSRKAQAGKFHIRIRAPKPSSVYWIKYRVAGNQQLSSEGYIFLKNGRVGCSEKLRGASGEIKTVVIARTRTANPYIAPLLRNYSLRAQERANVLRNSGRISSKEIRMISESSTLNVG